MAQVAVPGTVHKRSKASASVGAPFIWLTSLPLRPGKDASILAKLYPCLGQRIHRRADGATQPTHLLSRNCRPLGIEKGISSCHVYNLRFHQRLNLTHAHRRGCYQAVGVAPISHRARIRELSPLFTHRGVIPALA